MSSFFLLWFIFISLESLRDRESMLATCSLDPVEFSDFIKVLIPLVAENDIDPSLEKLKLLVLLNFRS